MELANLILKPNLLFEANALHAPNQINQSAPAADNLTADRTDITADRTDITADQTNL